MKNYVQKRELIITIMHTIAGAMANLMITGRDLIGWVDIEIDKVQWDVGGGLTDSIRLK